MGEFDKTTDPEPVEVPEMVMVPEEVMGPETVRKEGTAIATEVIPEEVVLDQWTAVPSETKV